MNCFVPVRNSAWIFPALLCLFSTGCALQKISATREEQINSLVPYHRAKIEGQNAPKFLSQRSALLIETRYFKLTHRGSDSVYFQLGDKKSQEFELGTATAVDGRGYFLTAAHCVEKDVPYLLFTANHKIQSVQPRVVWRGQNKTEPDLALLYVPIQLDHVFSWAPAFKPPDPVFITGSGVGEKYGLEFQYAAGKILSRFEAPTQPHSLAVLHDAPLRRGNSGGSVVNLQGQLIAIDVAIEYEFHLWTLSGAPVNGTALRPDLTWLKTLIDQDQTQISLKKIPTRP